MPADAISNLQELEWKGLKLPFMTAQLGFSQASAEKKFLFQDQALMQRIGRSNQTFRYQVPFYDGLKKYGALFTDNFDAFYELCLSREPGTLIDPLRGEIRAVVATLQVSLDPSQARDGVLIDIELVEAPLEIQRRETQSVSLKKAVQEAEQERESFDLPPYPEFTEPLVNPLDLATGVVQQVSLIRDKTISQIERETERVNRFSGAVEETTDPEKWRFLESLSDLKLSLLKAHREVLAGTKRMTLHLVEQTISIHVLAANLGMSTEDLLVTNPNLAEFVVVAPGTQVLFLPRE